MLEVVEHQQQPLLPEVVLQAIEQRPFAGLADAERLGDGRADQTWIGQWGQGNEEDAVLEAVEYFGGNLEGQAGLAGPAGASQGEQADILAQQQPLHLRHLPLAADEWAALERQVVRPGAQAPQRRELRRQAGDDELEDALRARQVLQAVLAQVTRARSLRQLPLDQHPCRLGEQHLAAVAGRAEAGGAVDIQADVAAGAEARLAGVQAHPHPDRDTLRPGILGQRSLRCHRGRDGVGGTGEDDEEAVALGIDLPPAVGLEGRSQQMLMRLQRGAVAFAEPLEQAG